MNVKKKQTALVRYTKLDKFRSLVCYLNIAALVKWEEVPQEIPPAPPEDESRIVISPSCEWRRALGWRVSLITFAVATLITFTLAQHLAYVFLGIMSYLSWRMYRFWNGIVTVARRSVQYATRKGLDANTTIEEEVEKFTCRKRPFNFADGFFALVAAIWFMFFLVKIVNHFFGKGV